MWSICSENNREGFEKISCKFTKWKLVLGLFLKKMQLLQDYHDGIIIKSFSKFERELANSFFVFKI